MFMRHHDPKEVEDKINSGSASVVDVLLADSVDTFFKSENEVVTAYFDNDKLAQLLDFCYMERETYSADNSKLAFVSTSIMASGKKSVLRFFFGQEGDTEPELPEQVLPPTEDTDYGYGGPPSPPICKFIKTEEKSYTENQEEITYHEYKTDRADTKHLDRLFSILDDSPCHTNMTAFGNFALIVKSFLNSDNVKSDFLKYVYSRREIFEGLVQHLCHHNGYQVLSSILNMQKWYSENSSALASQFLVHRLRSYSELADRLAEPATEIDVVESIVDLFFELVTDNRHIWDSVYFIDRVLLNSKKVEALVARLMDQREKARVLLRLLTTLVEYCNKEYDEEEDNSNSSQDKNDEYGDEAKGASDDDGPKIEVNIIVPEVSSPADELRSAFLEKLRDQFRSLASLVVAAPQTDQVSLSTAGLLYRPCGLTVVQFSKLVHACLKSKLVDFQETLLREGVLDALQQVFLAASTNNILHNQFSAIAKLVVGQGEGPLFRHFFESELLATLFATFNSVVASRDPRAKQTSLFLGHIVSIGKEVEALREVASLDAFFRRQDWRTFAMQHLADIVQKENTVLGRRDPHAPQDDSMSENYEEALNSADFVVVNQPMFGGEEAGGADDDPWRQFNDFSPEEVVIENIPGMDSEEGDVDKAGRSSLLNTNAGKVDEFEMEDPFDSMVEETDFKIEYVGDTQQVPDTAGGTAQADRDQTAGGAGKTAETESGLEQAQELGTAGQQAQTDAGGETHTPMQKDTPGGESQGDKQGAQDSQEKAEEQTETEAGGSTAQEDGQPEAAEQHGQAEAPAEHAQV